MSGSKYNNAVKGIAEEVDLLKQQTDVDIKLGIVGFSSAVAKLRIETLDNTTIQKPIFSQTALNDAIGFTLRDLLEIKKDTEKAVVKIFTDGEENASRSYSYGKVRDLIKQAESQGVTVTFIGTEQDVKQAKSNYLLSEGNTFAYENNAQGVQTAFRKMSGSTVTYSKFVAAGASDEELKTGFFTKTVGTL